MALAKSLFVSDAIHERKAKLGDGQEHVLHFRELPHADFRRFFQEERSDDDAVSDAALSRLIAKSLCEPNGKPALTFAQAKTLKATVASRLGAIVLEVNGIDINGNARKNASPPEEKTGSGTSSPSPSADEPLLS